MDRFRDFSDPSRTRLLLGRKLLMRRPCDNCVRVRLDELHLASVIRQDNIETIRACSADLKHHRASAVCVDGICSAVLSAAASEYQFQSEREHSPRPRAIY